MKLRLLGANGSLCFGGSIRSYWLNTGMLASLVVLSLTSCGGGGGGGTSGGTVGPVTSSGLKIFVTSESHVGDFSNDPTLTGNSGIEKADNFCATSSSRPDGSQYKALLVDGINRDAVSLTDWVLQPNTTYYRPNDNIEIGATTNLAIFPTLFIPLTNSIADAVQVQPELGYVWIGIGDLTDFSAGDHCNFWSDSGTILTGVLGIYHQKDRAAFNPVNLGGSTCIGDLQVYCVEQP